MIELLRRFLKDPDFATARIRGVLFGVGTLFTQGIISLDILSEKLGPVGWWCGVALMIVAVSLRAGGTPDSTAVK